MTELWLDDLRPAPQGWTHAHSVNEAIEILSAGPVEVASLDHDLGDFAVDGGDGWRLVDWMAETKTWPLVELRVHSANPVGVRRMLGVIDRYGPFVKTGLTTRRRR